MSEISDLLQNEEIILEQHAQSSPLTQLDEMRAQKEFFKNDYRADLSVNAGPEYKNMLRKLDDAGRADLASKFAGFQELYANIRANIKKPHQLHGLIVLFGKSPDSVDEQKYATQYHTCWPDADRALRDARANGSFIGPVIAYQFHMQFGATDNYAERGNFCVKNMPEKPAPKGGIV